LAASQHAAGNGIDEDSNIEEDDDDDEQESSTNIGSNIDHDLIALKVLSLLRPELRRLKKTQAKQHRAINTRLNDIEEKISATFFLISNITPKIDYLVNRVGAEDGEITQLLQAPPPLTFPTPTAIPDTTPTDKPQTVQQPTYADVLNLTKECNSQKPVNHKVLKTNNNPTKMQRTITITRNSMEKPPVDPLTVRNMLNTTLKEAQAPANAIISNVSLNQNNNFVLTTREDCPATTVLQYKEILERTLQSVDNTTTTMKPQENWAKVTIHGINLLMYPDDSTGMNLLREEIESHNPNIKLTTTPRYITRPEARVGKRDSSVCVCLNSEALANQMVRRGVLVDCQRRKAERYWPARPTDQCSSCQGFGHHWRRCTAELACRMCSKSHKTSEHNCSHCPNSRGKRCPHTILRCANCDGDHYASDRSCPVIVRLRAHLPATTSTTATSKFSTMDTPVILQNDAMDEEPDV